MPKTLVEKITECCRDAAIVFKEGRADQGWKYLRILDIADALRERFFAAGILIVPSDVECVVSHRESAITDRQWTSATVKTLFVIRDDHEKFAAIAYGYACDLDGHAVAIAQTVALKSFLKRLALIFGEYDDPEKQETTGYDLNLAEGEQEWGSDLREWPISRHEVIAFNASAAASGHTKKGIAVYLDANFGIDKPSDLKRKDLPQALAWANALEKPKDVTDVPA